MADNPIYMDYAAATPLDRQVFEQMLPFLSDRFFNPSALYSPAVEVRRALESARTQTARLIGARASEIVFTAGGTEANNLAILGLLAKYPAGHIVTTAIEHESVLLPARRYAWTEVRPEANGIVTPVTIKQAISENTVLVSVMYANNEVGTIQPIREIAAIVRQIRRQRLSEGNDLPLLFHTDACQAVNFLDLQVGRLGVDMMTLNGGKIYGPKQSGALYIHAGNTLEPLIQGGGQEHGLRSGTENLAGAIGFAAALQDAQLRRQEESLRLQALQKKFIESLHGRLPESRINGSLKQRLPSNVHVTLLGQDNERLLYGLDQLGIWAAGGSACSADKGTPSHVLTAMGLSEPEARASLRFTMGRGTTDEQIERLVSALAKLVSP